MLRGVCDRLDRLARKMFKGYPSLPRWVQAEDVLQNSLMRLLKSLQEIQPESMRAFFGLAATHIHRELLDLARKWAGLPSHVPLQENETSLPGDAEDLEKWCAFHEEVEKLPSEEREVMELTYYHGWTQVEVAQLFQVDDRTVRRWWKSALARLQKKLKQIPGL